MSRRTMSRAVKGALWLAGLPVLLGVAPAFGQDRAEAGKGPGEVTFDVVERPLRDVVAYIQEKTDVNLVLTKDAEDIPVTVKLKSLPWREALDVVAERAGAQVDERSPNLIRIEKPPRVTFEFENADVRVVIKAIADTANANIVLGREVEGTVSLTLTDIPWRTALDTIVKTLGFTVVQEDRGILRIVDPATLKAQLETRVFRLRFVRPPANYRPIIETQVSVKTVEAPPDKIADIEREFNLLNAFKQTVAPEGSVTYVRETNSLIVTGTTPKLEALDKLIARIDVEPAQVYVDLKFITTSNTDFLDVGLNPGTNGLAIGMTFGNMLHDIPFQIGKGGFEDHLSPYRSPTGGFGPEPVSSSASAFTFGTLDFTSTQIALNLIKRDVSSRIVQAPKLVALDNQEATIFVGETIRFAQTNAQSNQSGGLEFSIEEAENSPVQVGFQMLMIPHVIPDKDQIMMTIIPQQRSLSGPDDGFKRYTTGGGGTTGEQEILLPQEKSSTVVTSLKLDNGHTAVIGGLLQEQDTKQVNKIPLLGDIPVLGWLFKGETTSKTRQNLVIFLTPRIVRDADQMKSLVVRELNERQDRLESEMMEIHGGTSVAPDTGSKKDAPAASKAGLAGPK